MNQEPLMRKMTVSTKQEQESSAVLRLGAFGFAMALVGMLLWSGNDQLNGGAEGALYFISWALIIPGLGIALPCVYDYAAMQGEPRKRKRP